MATNKDKLRAEAQKYLQKGQLDKAIKSYLKLLEEDPKDVRTLQKVADLQTRAGQNAEATETYAKVAQFYSEQGFSLKAVAVYKQILKLDPDIIEVNLRIAELYQQLGLLSDASTQYRHISSLYEKSGRIDESLDVVKKMVELDADNVASRVKLAELYAKRNMREEARGEFKKSADYLKAHDRLDDYVNLAERIIHFDPDDLATTRELSAIYIKQGDARRALAKLQTCFRANPKDIDTLGLLAEAFRELGQAAKAASVYREVLKILRETGRPEQMPKVARRLLTLAPDDAEASQIAASAPSEETSAEEPAAAPGAVPRIMPSQRAVEPPPAATERNTQPQADLQAAPQAVEEPAEEPVEEIEPIEADAVVEEADEDSAQAAGQDEVEVEVDLAELAGASPAKVQSGQSEMKLKTTRPSEVAGVKLGDTTKGQISQSGSSAVHFAEQEVKSGASEVAAPAPSAAKKQDGRNVGDLDELDALLAGAVPSTKRGSSTPARQAASPAAPTAEPAAKAKASALSALPNVDDILADIDKPRERSAGRKPPATAATAEPHSGAALEPKKPAQPLDEVSTREPASTKGAAEPVASTATDARPPPEPAITTEAPAPAPPQPSVAEEIEEISFFVEQGLLDEAREALARFEANHPAHEQLAALRAKLDPPKPAADPAPASAPEPAAELAPAPADDAEPEPELEVEGNIIDEIAEDLQQAAEQDDLQISLSDVFEEFKRGVAQQVDAQDFETHYNLGIAYRDMGLFDDAVREFTLAMSSPDVRVKALTMIGLCQLELGKPDEALQNFLLGLNSEGVTSSAAVALRYEIARAYESMGRYADALKFYEKAVAMDAGFRDVQARLAEVQKLSGESGAAAGTELDELLDDKPAGSSKISYL